MKVQYPIPTSMTEYKIIEKARENESFKEMIVYRKDITHLVIKDIQRRSRTFNHSVVVITGETGSGKSITGITLAKWLICPGLTIKNICFTPEQVIERCKELKRDTVVIMDESALAVGVGSLRESLELRNLEEITRKYKLSFVFISPTPRTHLTAHYHLELFYKNENTRVNWLAVHEDDKYMGYIKIKVDPDDPIWKEYDSPNGIKNQFIEKYLERNVTRLDYKKMVEKIKKDERIQKLLDREGKVKNDDMLYIIGQNYPSITTTERKELMTELKISHPELFVREKA
jgi:predicted GTPase